MYKFKCILYYFSKSLRISRLMLLKLFYINELLSRTAAVLTTGAQKDAAIGAHTKKSIRWYFKVCTRATNNS